MELKPGYYIVRREGESEAGHLERLDVSEYMGSTRHWDTIGSEVDCAEPDGDIIAGPFTMAEIIAALRRPTETGEQ